MESTFSSLPDVAASQYPWLPTRLIMRNRMNSVKKIARYTGSVLQVHSGADRIIPIAVG